MSTRTRSDGFVRLMFAIEDRLLQAADVEGEFDRIVATAAALMRSEPDRSEFAHSFRILFRPLVDLELGRRAASE